MENILKTLFPNEIRIATDYPEQSVKVQKEEVDISDFLKNLTIFSGLDEDTLNQISKIGMRKSFSKNSVIIFEDEKSSAFYLIIKGKLKVSRVSDDGKEVILTILNEKDFFGEMSILDEAECSANVIALENSEIFIIQRNEFLNLLNKYPDISIALLKELINRIRYADTKIKSLGLNNAEQKVASVVIELMNKSGRIDENRAELDEIPFQHDLANMAGTSRETISRTLNSFVRRGLIEFNGSKLTILDFSKFMELFQ